MATYSFRIKKGKYLLELSTSDKELLVSQFELWVKDAGAYAKKRRVQECKELVNTQIKAEEEITKKNIETQLANHPKVEIPQPEENTVVTMLGCEKVLPWKYEDGKMIIDTTPLKYNDLKSDAAWTFKISR